MSMTEQEKTSNKTQASFNAVSFHYKGHDALVLDRLTFAVPVGSFTAIVGPSGSGKSTILKMLAGLIAPSEGTVEQSGRMSMVFQAGTLLPWKSAEENVALGLIHAPLGERERIARARAALGEVGVREYAHELPRNLSGGQRQRVGIARALVTNPDFLLLDEPFSALDVETAEHLHRELIALWHRRHLTVVMVSHSPEEAVFLSQRIIVMRGGRIVKTIEVPFRYPRHVDSDTVRVENEVRALVRAH